MDAGLLCPKLPYTTEAGKERRMNDDITNDEQYGDALFTLSILMDCDPDVGTPDGDELAALSDAIDAYECASEERWHRERSDGC